jgi:hypothetical protein
MENIKFVVKLNRVGGRTAQYVKRNQTPLQTTPDRKRALVMGKYAAEDLIRTMTNSHCTPELVSVKVPT